MMCRSQTREGRPARSGAGTRSLLCDRAEAAGWARLPPAAKPRSAQHPVCLAGQGGFLSRHWRRPGSPTGMAKVGPWAFSRPAAPHLHREPATCRNPAEADPANLQERASSPGKLRQEEERRDSTRPREACRSQCERDKRFDTPCPSLASSVSGGGGIRTHGTAMRYTGFRDRPFQPLRHPSVWGIEDAGAFEGRRDWKNWVRIAPHSVERTPEVKGTRWLKRGSVVSR